MFVKSLEFNSTCVIHGRLLPWKIKCLFHKHGSGTKIQWDIDPYGHPMWLELAMFIHFNWFRLWNIWTPKSGILWLIIHDFFFKSLNCQYQANNISNKW
jgi:hypothetical protein